jgi:hypothetical protein
LRQTQPLPITLKQARAIASAHFNQSLVAFSELSDGFFNATYRLDLADGAVRKWLYNLYLYLIMVIECIYRQI